MSEQYIIVSITDGEAMVHKVKGEDKARLLYSELLGEGYDSKDPDPLVFKGVQIKPVHILPEFKEMDT